MKNAATHKLDDSTCLVTGKSIAKRPPFKLEVTLLCFLRAGNTGMNQPEANKLYGETCLHTSVSTLQNNHGICLFRRSEPWKHRHGGNTHFTRYKLMDGKAEVRALALLNSLRKRRWMCPIQPGQYFDLPNKAA